jgi:hypothetical protein
MDEVETVWEINLFLIATLLTMEFHIILTVFLLGCAFSSFINNMSVIMALKRNFFETL